jgi:hypothetical protein
MPSVSVATFLAAATTAPPTKYVARDAPWMPLSGTRAVSEFTTSTQSRAMPRTSAAICAIVVFVP